MPSRLSPQWLCGNSCTSEHDVQLHIAGTTELKSVQQAKQGAIYKWSSTTHRMLYNIYVYIHIYTLIEKGNHKR